jgi:hypothetical protein
MTKNEYTTATEQVPVQEISRRDSNLRFISSPVATGLSEKAGHERVEAVGLESQLQADVERLGHRYKDNHDCPEFIKHSNSTNYEVCCLRMELCWIRTDEYSSFTTCGLLQTWRFSRQ